MDKKEVELIYKNPDGTKETILVTKTEARKAFQKEWKRLINE